MKAAARRLALRALNLLPPGMRARVQTAVAWSRRAWAGRPSPARVRSALLPVPVGEAGRPDRIGVLVVALEVGEAELDRLAGELGAAQHRTGARLLFVVDAAVPALRGLPYEYIPPRSDWEAQIDPGGYDDFLASRLRAVVDTYAPDRVLVVPASRALPAAALEVLLT